MASVAWPLRHEPRPLLSARGRRTLRGLVGVAAVLTLVDGLATLAWLHLGHAEGNPLLVALIAEIGAAPAMAVRVTVGLALLSLLAWTVGRARLAPYAIGAAAGMLGGVTLWHGYGVLLHLGVA